MDSKLFVKSRAGELKAELEQATKKSKSNVRIKAILKKVVANYTMNNNEVGQLYPEIAELLKLDDMEIRKMCLYFVSIYSSTNLQHSVRILPTLVGFLDSSDPILRSFTLRICSAIPIKEYMDAIIAPTRDLLRDDDPYVRKAACFAVARIYQHDAKLADRAKLADHLVELVYDSNPTVVSNALAAVNDVVERGISVNFNLDRQHSLQIIELLPSCNEWSRTYMLNALMSFVPQTAEDALMMIEKTLPSLVHENTSVALNAVKLIVYLSEYVNEAQTIIPSLSKRLGSSLVSLLTKPPEIQFLVLRNVILLLLGKKNLVQFDVEMFFCNYEDQIYVKDTKLEIMYLLANEDNLSIVLRELEEYATEVDVQMARKAIRAFGNLAVKLDSASTQCVEVIMNLVSNGISYVVQESVIVIKNILRKYPGEFDFAIQELVKYSELIDDPDAKTAMIWIIGQYNHIIEDASQLLNEFTANFKEDPIEVQLASLTAVVKLYLSNPGKGEQLVLKVLKWATEDVDNPDIRDRGFMYWRLLSAQGKPQFADSAKSVVMSSLPIISSHNDNIDPAILEELELNIGTLASIYLKPVTQVFRLAKPKELKYSPALVDRERRMRQSHESVPDSRSSSPQKQSSRYNSANVSNRKERESSSSEFVRPRESSIGASSMGVAGTNFAKRLGRRASVIGKKVGL